MYDERNIPLSEIKGLLETLGKYNTIGFALLSAGLLEHMQTIEYEEDRKELIAILKEWLADKGLKYETAAITREDLQWTH